MARDASQLVGADHVRAYRETAGAIGHDWRGTTTLLLTSTGRRSGEPRTTPLIYGRHGDDYVVVASNDGADAPPAWYRNLTEHPDVTVQVRGERFGARAREATAEEKPRLWQEMVARWPAYDDYRRKTSREMALVVLERRS